MAATADDEGAGPSQLRSTPVTIVTGFLGAGKTSLLNKVVKQYGEDKRIAVMENEFGEVNLDSKLVSNQLQSKEDLVSISHGCVCCSMRKDILAGLAELERRSAQARTQYDNIVLETTGLADPAPVAFTFFANPWVKKRFHLDSIVCVVDAKYLDRQLVSGGAVPAGNKARCGQGSTAAAGGTDTSTGAAAVATTHTTASTDSNAPVNEVFNQIAFADLVLLNKVDLVSDEAAVAVERAVREINSLARVVHTRLNDDDFPNWLSTILDSKRFSLEYALEMDKKFLESASSDDETDLSGQAAGAAGLAAGADDNKPGAASAAAAGDVPEEATTSSGIRTTGKRAASEMEGEAQGLASAKTDLEEEQQGSEPVMQRKPRKRIRVLHDLGSVRSVCVLLPGQLDTFLFNMFMRDFLQERGKDIFRSKGRLCVHGHRRCFNFQGVHETFQLAPCHTGVDMTGNPHSEIVFIGRKLDKEAIKQGLLSCLWRPLPPGWTEYHDKRTNRSYYVDSRTGAKSWTRPLHETEAERVEDQAMAAAAFAEGAERTVLSESSVQQPKSVRPASTSKAAAAAMAGSSHL